MFRGSLVVNVNTRADVRVHDMGGGRPLASVVLDEGLTIQSGTPGPPPFAGYVQPDGGPEVLARLFEDLAARVREEAAMWLAAQGSSDQGSSDQGSPGQ